MSWAEIFSEPVSSWFEDEASLLATLFSEDVHTDCLVQRGPFEGPLKVDCSLKFANLHSIGAFEFRHLLKNYPTRLAEFCRDIVGCVSRIQRIEPPNYCACIW